jgi:hypothetical protein
MYEHTAGVTSRFVHVIPAGLTATSDLRELKYGFDLTVDDTDTDQDVDDALFVDDIRNGPQVETVIGNWIDRAEVIIAGLSDPYTVADYWAGWSQQDTAKTRNDGRTALITGRGWTVTSFHQHEGDGTNTDG